MQELPGICFFYPFFDRVVFLFNLSFFFYLLAGFILLMLSLYSFTRCCVKRISIFAYKAFVWREYLGDGFFCNGNRRVVCMPNALALHFLTH